MRILVNGEPRQFAPGTTIAQLVTLLGLDRFPIAIERNQTVVAADAREATTLADGDALEIVTFVGGG